VNQAELEWQFWTKIVVEAIGCLGAGILIYVWGKSYVSVINKWIAFNRTFIIVSSSPPPIKKPLPVDTKPQSSNANTCTPHSIDIPPGSICRSSSHTGLSLDASTAVSSPVGGCGRIIVGESDVGDGGGGTCPGVDGSTGLDANDASSSDKSREAKDLLLPPVVYSPPSDH
jgi:hypothetical protein